MHVQEHVKEIENIVVHRVGGEKDNVPAREVKLYTVGCDCGWKDEFLWHSERAAVAWIAERGERDHRCP